MVHYNNTALPIINGEKCYPLCNWEHNQHKIYNAHDRAMNRLYEYYNSDTLMDEDYEGYEEALEWSEKVDMVLSMFDNHIVGNMVYLPWKWYKIAKEILASY